LRFALKISPDIRAVHVDCGEGSAAFQQQWSRYVEEPAQQAGIVTPQLVILPSRYRLILAPIVEYVLEAERCCPNFWLENKSGMTQLMGRRVRDNRTLDAPFEVARAAGLGYPHVVRADKNTFVTWGEETPASQIHVTVLESESE
jgi:hypothetical protein